MTLMSDPASPYAWSDNSGGINGQFAYGMLGALAFAGMGGGALFGAWSVYDGAGMHPGVYILSAVGLSMLGVAAWLGRSAVAIRGRRRERARRVREQPDRPWIARDDWARQEVEAVGDDARVRLDAVPAVTGGAVSGQIAGPDIDTAPGQTVRVTLSCRVREASGDTDTTWRDECEVRAEPRGAGEVRIPFSFALPADAPPATPDPDGKPRVDWRLQVHDEGWDGPVLFHLPVFERTGAAEDETPPAMSRAPGDAFSAERSSARSAGDLDDVEVTGHDGFRAVISGGSVRYHGSRIGTGIFLAVFLAIHAYVGYTQFLMEPGATGQMVALGIHGVVGLGTAFFVYRMISPKGAAILVTVDGGRLRAHMDSGDDPFLDVPLGQVDGISVAVADRDRPRLGYDLRVDLNEPISRGAASDALADLGARLDQHQAAPAALDPRQHPPLYLAFDTRADAEALAARIRQAVGRG